MSNLNQDYQSLPTLPRKYTIQEPGTLLPHANSSRSRLVKRSNGRSLVHHTNVGSLRLQIFGYVTDGFTTIMNSPWWVIILLFVVVYVASWIIFGGVWTLVALTDDHYNNTCLFGVHDFNSALLFSIETQLTIGYGNYYVLSECGFGIFLLMLQCLVGLIIDSFALGLIFSKLTRPRNRRKTIVFSEHAVIFTKNGERYLQFRVCDLRRSQLVECHIRITLYWYKVVNPDATSEETRYEFQSHDLECGYDSGTDRVLLLTPVLAHHKISDKSPLHGVEDFSKEDIEILVNLEGIVESTGMTLQALWSYTSQEIQVDHKFVPMVSRREGKHWEVDFSKVNSTEPFRTV